MQELKELMGARRRLKLKAEKRRKEKLKVRTATGMKVDALGDTDIIGDDELFALAAIKRKQLSGVDNTAAPDAEEMAEMEREESDDEEERGGEEEEGSDEEGSDEDSDAEKRSSTPLAARHVRRGAGGVLRHGVRALLQGHRQQQASQGARATHGHGGAGRRGGGGRGGGGRGGGGDEVEAVVHIGEEGEEEEEENPLVVRLGESSASERVQAQWFTQDLFDGLDLEVGAQGAGEAGEKAVGRGEVGSAVDGALQKNGGRKGKKGPQGESRLKEVIRGVREREEGEEEGEEGEVEEEEEGTGGVGGGADVQAGKAVSDASRDAGGKSKAATGKGDREGEGDKVEAMARGGQVQEEAAGFEVVPEERLSASEGGSSDSDSDSDAGGGGYGARRGGKQGRTEGGGAAGGYGGGAMEEGEEEEWDSDGKAETLAYARRMLRKRDRDALIDDAYNRYMFDDDTRALPKWFADDERRHMAPQRPITKDEVLELKAQFRAINARPTKKVAEAKGRKRRRLMKQVEAARQKATAISEQPDLNERSKGRLMARAYSKVAAERAPKKIVVVAKKGQQGNRGRGVKNSIMVDRRMKKDLRADKANAKKGKGRKGKAAGGKGGSGGKGRGKSKGKAGGGGRR
ncbi:hypothetical protein CLOP_g19950 [Closterium sp. NIES-67]|nr:hypothetical protein CLOP_g19950 [Closterium sp. NIES-67]